jgi:hypothetical protein
MRHGRVVRCTPSDSGRPGTAFAADFRMRWCEPLGIESPVDGVLDHVARRGQRLANGDVLAVVGGRPVIWLDGGVPAWRDLTIGSESVDVIQLKRALIGLGHHVEGRPIDRR